MSMCPVEIEVRKQQKKAEREREEKRIANTEQVREPETPTTEMMAEAFHQYRIY